jgi:hypothetical protein
MNIFGIKIKGYGEKNGMNYAVGKIIRNSAISLIIKLITIHTKI